MAVLADRRVFCVALCVGGGVFSNCFPVGCGCFIGGNASGWYCCRRCRYRGVWQGIALFGAGLACAGIGILLFIGCLYTVKGIVFLTKELAVGIKKAFIRKEEER